jgi:hypothetical protein
MPASALLNGTSACDDCLLEHYAPSVPDVIRQRLVAEDERLARRSS